RRDAAHGAARESCTARWAFHRADALQDGSDPVHGRFDCNSDATARGAWPHDDQAPPRKPVSGEAIPKGYGSVERRRPSCAISIVSIAMSLLLASKSGASHLVGKAFVSV